MIEIVAELSGNHAGELANALRLIDAAKRAGADAVKFQCFIPERLAAKRSGRPDIVALAGGVPLIALYHQIWTPWDWFPQLIEHCQDVGIAWFSSVFDPEDVAFLEALNCPRYKISAFEMLDWEVIRAVKKTGKPIVMSVRPRPGVTILVANDYDGKFQQLGVSWHAPQRDPLFGDCTFPTDPGCPMVEYHLRLEGVDTPDKDFSVTEDELHGIVGWLR